MFEMLTQTNKNYLNPADGISVRLHFSQLISS